jgi:DNA-binding NarL/FixJ family response regulator
VTRVAIVAAAAVRPGLEALVARNASLTVTAVAASVDAIVGDPQLASSEVVLLHAMGVELVLRDLDALPPIPIVVLLHGSPARDATPMLLAAGARGVLPDDSTAEEVTAAVDAAAAGLVIVAPDQVRDLVDSRVAGVRARALPDARRSGAPNPGLTQREREILAMLAEGLPNKLIASRLGISDHTVKTHLEAIFDKLGASNRAEAVARAVRTGLLLL